MAVNLSPLGGAGWQFFDNSGVPLAGGLLYSYEAGTTTPAPTYTSAAGTIANTNPIVLDAAGRPPSEVWLSSAYSYKLVLRTSTSVLLWTMDNLTGINIKSADQAYATATAGQTAFTVGFTYTVSNNSLSVLVNGSKQIVTLNYTETSSTVVTFLTGLNLGDIVEFVQ
jgi:hypothetical protein